MRFEGELNRYAEYTGDESGGWCTGCNARCAHGVHAYHSPISPGIFPVFKTEIPVLTLKEFNPLGKKRTIFQCLGAKPAKPTLPRRQFFQKKQGIIGRPVIRSLPAPPSIPHVFQHVWNSFLRNFQGSGRATRIRHTDFTGRLSGQDSDSPDRTAEPDEFADV